MGFMGSLDYSSKRRSQGQSAAHRNPRSLRGLGASTGEIQLILEQTINGQYADELQAAKKRSDENMVYTINTLFSVQDMPSSDEKNALLNAANAARAAAMKERSSLQTAINDYSRLASNIQTYSGGYYKPKQLSEVATATIVLAGIAAVATIAVAFSYSYGRAKSDANASVSSIKNLSDLVSRLKDSGATPAEIVDVIKNIPAPPSEGLGSLGTIGLLVVIGVVGFVGFKVLRARGKI